MKLKKGYARQEQVCKQGGIVLGVSISKFVRKVFERSSVLEAKRVIEIIDGEAIKAHGLKQGEFGQANRGWKGKDGCLQERLRDKKERGKRRIKWCCERGLNSRPLPYQGSALPLSYRSRFQSLRCLVPYCQKIGKRTFVYSCKKTYLMS